MNWQRWLLWISLGLSMGIAVSLSKSVKADIWGVDTIASYHSNRAVKHNEENQ
jgi:hypothetical protein